MDCQKNKQSVKSLPWEIEVIFFELMKFIVKSTIFGIAILSAMFIVTVKNCFILLFVVFRMSGETLE